MRTFASQSAAFLSLLVLGITACAWAENPATEAIQLYRAGKFAEADARLSTLHAAQPEETRITYYLAMTEAQLAHFEAARRLYNEVVLLEPNSQIAALAEQGLKYLPAGGNTLDAPPTFGAAPQAFAPAATGTVPQAASNGMSAQDMAAWQMMMSQMGGGQNNNGGMNGMMGMPGMPGQPGAASPYGQMDPSQMDPSTMSTLMMNSMMQNYNFSDKNDNDR